MLAKFGVLTRLAGRSAGVLRRAQKEVYSQRVAPGGKPVFGIEISTRRGRGIRLQVSRLVSFAVRMGRCHHSVLRGLQRRCRVSAAASGVNIATMANPKQGPITCNNTWFFLLQQQEPEWLCVSWRLTGFGSCC